MPRLFISYSRNDETFARRLATSLSEMGADIWIDLKDIPAGMKWSSAIQQGLDVCDAMIVVITPSSASSQNVEDEWQYYRDRGKPIVPVLVAPAQLHYQLSRLQYINFYGQPYEIALTQLHTELWRSGISLRPPPNAVTTPVPRAPTPSYTPPASAGPTSRSYAAPPPAARPQPRPKSRGPGLMTLGCAGLLVVAVLGVGVFFALGGMDLLNSTSTTATRQPATSVTLSITETAAVVATPQAMVASDSARLRTGPGVTYPALDGVFALRGDRYDVIARARSLENTEDWLLIAHPTAGRVWISAVVVDIIPDGVEIAPALTVPPTLTPTSTPSPTPTMTPTAAPATRTIPFVGQIAFSGQVYTADFNTEGFTIVRVTARSSFATNIQITLLTSGGSEVARNFNTLSVNVEQYAEYQVVVSDPAGGTGSIEFTIELSGA